MRLGFAGTPEFAATILRALLDAGQSVVLVLTQPDRPTGRGRKVSASAVKALARERGLPVEAPPRLQGYPLAGKDLDLLIVAAYGLLLPAGALGAPRLGCLNVHASLLPRWRGAAPVERAIMAGDTETGVCLMGMELGLDTGPVYARATTPIGVEETGSALETRLAVLGATLLLSTLPVLDRITPDPQPEQGITYARKLTPEDSRADWSEGSVALARRVRALTHRQPLTVYARDAGGTVRIRLLGAVPGRSASPDAPPGTILSISPSGLELAAADGSFIVKEVQLNRGKGRPVTPSAAANGYPGMIAPGCRLLADPDLDDPVGRSS